jgi:hypothetical protein
MTMNRPEVGPGWLDIQASELTGACIAMEVFWVFRGVHVGGKHLSVDGTPRIIAFSEMTALEVLRCLLIY